MKTSLVGRACNSAGAAASSNFPTTLSRVALPWRRAILLTSAVTRNEGFPPPPMRTARSLLLQEETAGHPRAGGRLHREEPSSRSPHYSLFCPSFLFRVKVLPGART